MPRRGKKGQSLHSQGNACKFFLNCATFLKHSAYLVLNSLVPNIHDMRRGRAITSISHPFLIIKVTRHCQCCTCSTIRFSIAHHPSSNYSSDSSTKTRFPAIITHAVFIQGGYETVCVCVCVRENVPGQGGLDL